MKNSVVFIILVLPLFIQSQVISCHKTVQKKTKIDKWEKVDYRLQIYEFADTAILRQTVQILSINPDIDSIITQSKDVSWIMTMLFERRMNDTIICHVQFSDKPYLNDKLVGCCILGGYYVQIIGIAPSFLVSTQRDAAFSYQSHKINWGTYNGKAYYMEEVGDDSVPQWKLEYIGKEVHLLSYYGIND